jgi:hypothetical protein
MFRLLTGRLVHEAPSAQEAIIAAATLPAPPLASVRGDVPASLAEIVDRALEFEAGDRWQSALEMQEAIRAVRRGCLPYEWNGISAVGGNRTARLSRSFDETPTGSFVEELSRGAGTSGGRRGRRAWLAMSIAGAFVSTGVLVVAVHQLDAPPARPWTEIESQPSSAWVPDLGPSVQEPIAGLALAESPPSPAPPSVAAASSSATRARESATRGRGATPHSRPLSAPWSAPAPLEEFLNERR